MIRPILEYGHTIYDNCSASAAQTIEKIQRQSAIACTGAYKSTSYDSLLTELNWDPLSTRRQTYKLITYYKIFHNIYPTYLHNLLPPPPPSNYNLRQQQSLRPRHTRLTSSYNSFFPSTTRAWNLLPQTTRDTPTVACFKHLIQGPTSKKPYHRICSNKQGVWLSRIRMGLSALNAHRHHYNFIPSPICTLCNKSSETALHYFTTCPTHQGARQTLFTTLQNSFGIDTTNHINLINTILEGHYVHPRHFAELFSAVSAFLSDTGRFR